MKLLAWSRWEMFYPDFCHNYAWDGFVAEIIGIGGMIFMIYDEYASQ